MLAVDLVTVLFEYGHTSLCYRGEKLGGDAAQRIGIGGLNKYAAGEVDRHLTCLLLLPGENGAESFLTCICVVQS